MIASYLLMACTLLLVMWQQLLPGLLCACLGFLLTRGLTSVLGLMDRRAPGPIPERWAQVSAATLVSIAPLIWLAIALTHSRGYLTDIPHQYKELLDYLANTVLELRQKLPTELASMLPQGAAQLLHRGHAVNTFCLRLHKRQGKRNAVKSSNVGMKRKNEALCRNRTRSKQVTKSVWNNALF